jgi:hypothetical protein
MAVPRACGVLVAILATGTAAAVAVAPAGAAQLPGPPHWAPAAKAAIHPGTQMFTKGAQCTARTSSSPATGTSTSARLHRHAGHSW